MKPSWSGAGSATTPSTRIRDRHLDAESGVPAPVNHPSRPQTFGGIAGLTGTSGMADLFKSYRSKN